MSGCGSQVPPWLLHVFVGVAVLLTFMSPAQIQGSHLPANYLSKSEEEVGTTIFPLSSRELEAQQFKSEEEEAEGEEITTILFNQLEEAEELSTSTTSTTSSSTTSLATTLSPARNDPIYYPLTSNGKRYKEIFAQCDSSKITIFSQFTSPFKGRIYAYGYADEGECGQSGGSASHTSENVTFTLPLGQCGVQMMAVDPEFESPKRHELTLYIQYSSFLQQVIDDKVSVSCVEIHKSPLEESMQILDFSDPSSLPSFRQGRRMGSVKPDSNKGSKSLPQVAQTRISSKIGESWMEILHGKDPSPKSRKMLPVAVGQDVTLVISTKVMRGYDARIVNCSANDGSRLGIIDGYRSQQVLDSAGCSVDTSLVPNFRRRRLPIESRNRMITLHFATFPAFKFPERDHLHIKCQVAYCQGPCPQETCDSGLIHVGTWRDKYGRIADALIDTTEIVNSIEVFAPELEDSQGGGHHFERHESNLIPQSGGGGSATDLSHASGRQMRFSSGTDIKDADSTNNSPHFMGTSSASVCVSPGTIILALVVLGVVLVVSATATLWFALKRSEARKFRQAVKHAPFQHAGLTQPYYRFSHW